VGRREEEVIRRGEAEEGIGPSVGGRSNLEGEEMRRRGSCMHEGWGEEKKRKKWPGR
jgi:hypothetical protein